LRIPSLGAMPQVKIYKPFRLLILIMLLLELMLKLMNLSLQAFDIDNVIS
jgi:hypothetical protein